MKKEKGDLPYEGILKEPRKVKHLGPLASEETVRIRSQKMFDEFIQKEKALYSHYELEYLPQENGHILARHLAHRHVPGFFIEKAVKRGRPKKWLGDYGMLFFLVTQAKLLKRNCSLREAVILAAKEIGEKVSTTKQQNTVYTRYHEVIKVHNHVGFMKKILEGSIKRHGITNELVELIEDECIPLYDTRKI